MKKLIKLLPAIFLLGLSSCNFKTSSSNQQTSSSDSINNGYTVVWKNYDGTVLETDTNVSKGTTPTYDGTVPTREEDDYCTYTFTGWSPEISKVNSDITYTAQFSKTIQNAKIKFDLNGGSSSHSKSSITVSSIDASNFFFDVSKVGFNFRGWAYNNKLVFDQFGNKVKIPDMEEAMTFVAMFAEDVYVKVDKSVDGGDITGEGTYDFNSVVTVSTTVNDYFTFDGWYKKNKLVSTSTSYSFTVDNDDVNLEARYKGQYFDVKIKSSHPLYGRVSFKEGMNYIDGFREIHQSHSYTSEVQLVLYKNDDYSYAFLGWFDEEDNLISKDMVYRFIMPHNDVCYVAKFDTTYTRLSIVKNYDAAGEVEGEGIYGAGHLITVNATTTNNVFSFDGWYINNEFENSGSYYMVTIPENDLTLEARWTLTNKNFNITYNLNGGTNNPSNPAKYNTLVETTFQSPTKYGCVFEGWYTSSDFSGEPVTSTKGKYTALELYAKWSYNDYYKDLSGLDATINSANGKVTIKGIIDKEKKEFVLKDYVVKVENQVYSDSSSKTSFSFIGTIENWLAIQGKSNLINVHLYLNEADIETTSITIPNSVTSIGDQAFYNCSSLNSIVIPNSVTSIGSDAFRNCSAEIIWGDNPTIKTIGDYAFRYYKGTSITIPNSVTSISSDAFSGCSAEIIWGDNPTIKTIGASSFSGYRGTSITIPKSVTSIGDSAFSGCSAEIIWEDNPTIKTIGKYAFRDYKGTSITIPNSVTSIVDYAFYNCSSLSKFIYRGSLENWLTIEGKNNLDKPVHLYLEGSESETTSVVIPNSVTSIGYGSFYNCSNLTSITIPDSVTYIGSNAFYKCTSIKSIVIPNSVTSIGDNAFSGCSSLSNFIYRGSLENWLAIKGKDNLNKPVHLYLDGSETETTSITIPNSITSISSKAFNNCSNLTSITIPNSITSISSKAFSGCSAEIIWGDNPTITTIGNYAFDGYKGTSITIPNSVTSIGNYAFSGCSAEIVWEDNPTITTIGNYAFDGYKGTSITIPNSVTSISSDAFRNCSAEIVWGDNPTITTIGISAFRDYKGTSITIPDSVTSIGNYAFYNCSDLTSITIPNSVTSIGYIAFYNCSSLSNFIYRGSLENWLTIEGKDNLDKPVHLYLDGSETETTSVVIPDTVTSIGNYAFYNCSDLTFITMPDSITSISSDAFRNCSAEIIWGDNPTITTIGKYAFRDYKGASITIPNSVTSIGDNAFSGCSSLTSIIFQGTKSEWKSIEKAADLFRYNNSVKVIKCIDGDIEL